MGRTADVLVVGGGVIGCAIAYESSKIGLKVILLERGRIGQESSSAAAGMLAPNAEADEDDAFLRLCRQGRALFPDYLDELREKTGESVEWHQDGLLHVAATETEAATLERRYQWQRKAGLGSEWITPAEARALEPRLRPTAYKGLYLPHEAHLDNERLTLVLAAAARLCGAEILERQGVIELPVSGNRVLGALTAEENYHAGRVINAAGAWAAELTPMSGTALPVAPVRGQILALRSEQQLVHRLVYSRDCYLVPRNYGNVLVGATVEWVGYDKQNTAGAIARLLRGARELVPELETAAFTRAWAGIRPGTPDALPILGKDPVWDGLIHATGHFRNGILLSALTGKLIAALIAGAEASQPLDPFTPARFQDRSAIEPAGESPRCAGNRSD